MKTEKHILLFFFFIISLVQSFGQTNNDYRTRYTTGGPYNWNTASNWQKYNSGVWATATTVPSSSVNVITILSGSNYKLDANLTLDQMVIQSSATLTVNSSKTLTLANGSGDDLVNSGTLTNSGTITLNSSTVLVNNGTINNNANFNVNSTINNNGIINENYIIRSHTFMFLVK